jgi:putative transposase
MAGFGSGNIVSTSRKRSHVIFAFCRRRRSLASVKKSRSAEEQIVGILKESEAGAKTPELCRKHGISSATFYA